MSENETKQMQAICPECGNQDVIVQTAPMKPARMFCKSCKWTSLDPRRAA